MEAAGRDPDDQTVVVWQADGSPRPGTSYGAPLVRLLRRRGFAVRLVHLPDRAPTAAERRAPFHVLSGGDTSVLADVAWVQDARRALTEVIGRARTGEARVVGICFGAQLLATALAGPGSVGPADPGMEVGLRRVHLTGPDPSGHDSLSTDTLVVGQFHHHQIDARAVTSAGCRVAMSNDHTTVQGFEVGRGITGYQFHPEWSPADVSGVLVHAEALIAEVGGSSTAARQATAASEAAWSATTFDRLVAARLSGGLPSPEGRDRIGVRPLEVH